MDMAWKKMLPLSLINLVATDSLLYSFRDIMGYRWY